jgi:hypothetical protein
MRVGFWSALLICLPGLALAGDATDAGWRDLIVEGHALDAFRGPAGFWREVGDVALRPGQADHLDGKEGRGVIINDPPGRSINLVTRDSFGDVEIYLEFCVPKGSNSGIKLMGLYEVQIHDSHGKVGPLKGDANGGIYPKATLTPRYHHLDDGYAPRVNASRPPGEWQSLAIRFRTPRFGEDGKKSHDARFERVELNGQVIHEDLDLPCPTGHAWESNPEVARGPILLQADHGPVAFRALRVRDLSGPEATD